MDRMAITCMLCCDADREVWSRGQCWPGAANWAAALNLARHLSLSISMETKREKKLGRV
jgi:hypothetical protein